ncbi:MAG: FG-GAP-like repeat-containing protein [Pseudomonadota bacterium]|nr:FG-GAP-like repeat-containing protein [Pseudomonadota bacterium]
MSHPSLRHILMLSLLTFAGAAQATSDTCEVVPPFTPSFDPVLEWEWTGSTTLPTHIQVMMTPIVIDVNMDGTPDVLFNSFAGSQYTINGVLRAISGADGSELWTVTDPAYETRGISQIAAGDIDNDGLPEICTVGESGARLLCFENDGSFKFAINSTLNSWGGPSFADLTGDGTVEIINGNQVFSSTGSLLWTGSGGVGGLPGTGPVSFAADINQDGDQEVVNGRTVYNPDGSVFCQNTSVSDGLAGVGNFDGDDEGEIALVSNGRVTLLDDDCTLLWTTAIPGGGMGGAPNIADFDNDGDVEIGVAGASRYSVFETNGTVKWSSVVQDFSSNRTGSSTFDFEGDGAAEVVYADERKLRIYDGATGTIRFEVSHASGTGYENPVIADVDGDGNAEIVISSNNYAFSGPNGIQVYADRTDGWVNTRGIWNQHAYSVTNVNEDGTIPADPDTNWLDPELNTFRSNSQGTGTTSAFAAPDLVASLDALACVEDSYDAVAHITVSNDGDAPSAAGVVDIYDGDPEAGGALVGFASIAALAPGVSVTVSQTFEAPGGTAEIFIVADADEADAECDEENTDSLSADLACTPNDPPVAVCADVYAAADHECLADESIDDGSYDPDGDPLTITQSPVGPYGPGTTSAELTVCDDSGACDTCTAVIEVVDETAPTVDCGATADIAPSDASVDFTATTTDNCGSTVTIDEYDCFKVNSNGSVQSKLDSCEVILDGDTITVVEGGGVGTQITWTATATDDAGNTVSTECGIEVANPGDGSGCNQGIGNGSEDCDPGNSNQGDDTNSNDENATSGRGNSRR